MEASGKAKTNWGWLKIFLVVIMKPLFFPFSRFQLIKAKLFLSSRHGNFRTFSIIFPRINSKGKIPIFLHGEMWSVALRYFLLPSWSLWPPYKLSTFKSVFNKGTHFWCIYWNFAYVPFSFFFGFAVSWRQFFPEWSHEFPMRIPVPQGSWIAESFLNWIVP